MSAYTYITEEERKSWRKVTDKNINDLFQEALEVCPSLLITERFYTVRKWFRREQKVSYTIYHDHPAYDGTAYQARYQIWGSGDIDNVAAYLCGIINGYKSKIEQL
jgi:hypothetical protein